MIDAPDRRTWPDAILVGFELNGLGLARALRRRGVRCQAVSQPGWSPAFASRSVRTVHQCGEWTRDCVIETLLAVGSRLERPGVLLFTKDESVLWAAGATEELARYFRFALPKPETVQLLMNKAQFYAEALREGWPVPRGHLLEHEDQLRAVLDDVPYPAILKPQLRNSEYRRHPIPKAFKVSNGAELLAAYRRIARYEPEVIVSEWIEGGDGTLYSCRGFWDREGRPVVQHAARKLMQWPVETGNMAALEIPDPADWNEPLAIANRVFRSVRMFGMAAMEYKRHRDGRFLILEPCVSRTVYSHEIGPLNGYDVPWAAYRYLAFEDVPGHEHREIQPPAAAGAVRLIDRPRARRAAGEYRRRGLMTETEIRDVFARPWRDMTHRADDPLPSLLLWGREAPRALLRRVVPRWLAEAIRRRKGGPPMRGPRAAAQSFRRALSEVRADRTLPSAAHAEAVRDRRDGLGADPGPERAILAALDWLAEAQDRSASADGGVARHFGLVHGWAASYPETTGYIIPTMLAAATAFKRPELAGRARQMADWLGRIQFPDGGFQGGVMGEEPVVPVTFNTGQILLGLAAAEQAFGGAYRDAMDRAARWLVETQDADGCWRRFPSPFTVPGEKVYYTHVAWGLLEADRRSAGRGYAEAALANVRWAITHQRPNGWFAASDLSDPEEPLTHTIGYTLRGVLEGYRHSRDVALLDSAVRTGDGLLSAVQPDGRLPGRLDTAWRPAARWVCLTGSAQIAACWLMLAEETGDARYRDAALAANAFVRRTLVLEGPASIRGGVKGSFPVDGWYGRYQYLSWAAKFLIDSCVMELAGPREPSPAI